MIKFFKELMHKWSGKTPKTVIVKFKDDTFGVKRGEYFAEYLDTKGSQFNSGHSSRIIYKYCRFKTILEAESALSNYVHFENYGKMLETFGDSEEVVKTL